MILAPFPQTQSLFCPVLVGHLPRPSQSMHFGDLSETTGRTLARATRPETHWPHAITRSCHPQYIYWFVIRNFNVREGFESKCMLGQL